MMEDSNQVQKILGGSQDSEVELDLRLLFAVAWADRWLIFSITGAIAISVLVVSMFLAETYRAEAILAPSDSEQSASGLSGQLGGAAALLGVNLGGNSGDKINTAIATLRSRQFLGRFIEENDLLVPLFASTWNKRNFESEIDVDVYDISSNTWTLDSGMPSALDAFERFSEILTVSGPDRNTGIVTVAILWHNPQEAADWANRLVASLNDELKARDVREANSAISYLQAQLAATQLVEMQRVFYQLIESQTRITMLADVRDEYVFRVIDPAVVPERRTAPQRVLLFLIGLVAGVMLSLFVVFLKNYFKPRNYVRQRN